MNKEEMVLPINQIVCDDCLEVMKSFPNHSIDAVITDVLTTWVNHISFETQYEYVNHSLNETQERSVI